MKTEHKVGVRLRSTSVNQWTNRDHQSDNSSSLKKRMEEAKGNWSEKLPSVVWSYRTTPRKGTGKSLFHLCFRIKALIPAKIGSLSQRNFEFHTIENERLLREDLLFS